MMLHEHEFMIVSYNLNKGYLPWLKQMSANMRSMLVLSRVEHLHFMFIGPNLLFYYEMTVLYLKKFPVNFIAENPQT